MSKLVINTGASDNDKSGDTLRAAFTKINANFTELYAGGASESQLTNGSYFVTLGADGVVDLSANGVIRNKTTSKYVNIVANDTVQLQWTTNTGVASSDPNNTAEPSNWLYVDSTGATIQTNNNVSGQSAYTTRFDNFGNVVFQNGNYFNGQTLVDITAGTNYTLKVAHGTTGSVFAVGTGSEAFGVANDSLNHNLNGYVPYNATASTMSFNVPGHASSLSINDAGVVTVTNGFVISGTGNLTFPDATVQTTAWTGILPSPTYSGNNSIGNVTPAPLNLNNTGSAGEVKTQLTLINTAGNANTGSAIDFFTYTDAGNGVPGARLQSIDNNNYSANFSIALKGVGNAGNNTLTTKWVFGADASLTFPDASVQTTAYTGITPNGTKASNAVGTAGQISYDASYIYICTATNTWKRAALTGGY